MTLLANAPPPYLLVGLNHRSAPVELRERLSCAAHELPAVLAELAREPHVAESLVLSTCNRFEVLACANGSNPDLLSFLARRARVALPEIKAHAYELQGEHVIQHLFRVACSLDSMVVGEPQILGQMKEAYALAHAHGAAQTHLDALLSRAFAVAKRVRNETLIGGSAVSVASVAVDLAKKIFGSLEGRTVYLVGAGKMIELSLRHLLASGAGTILVSNRTFERACALAERYAGTAIPFEQMHEFIPQADIVITSTGAPQPIFRREQGEEFMQRRRNRPMFFIDIAVPRDVAPEMNRVDGLFVYDIDDLQQAVASNVADRGREAERAEAIILEEVGRFRARIRELDVVPTIVDLQGSMELLRQTEIERVRGRLGRLTPQQEEAIDALTKGIVNKVLHTPIAALKTAAKTERSESVIDMVAQLFNLHRKKKKDAPQT